MSEKRVIVPPFELDDDTIAEIDSLPVELSRVYVELVALLRRAHNALGRVDDAREAWLPSAETFEIVQAFLPKVAELYDFDIAVAALHEALHDDNQIDEAERCVEKLKATYPVIATSA